VRRALKLHAEGEFVWHASGTAFEKILKHEQLTISEHLQVDDSDFLFHVKQWQQSDDAILRDLSRRFVSRRLFKAIDLDMPEQDRQEFLADAREAVRAAGFDPDYYFIEDKASDVPYYSYYAATQTEPKARIYVESGYAQPQLREITEVSNVVRGLQHGYELHRVCFPAEVKTAVYERYHQPTVQRESAASGDG